MIWAIFYFFYFLGLIDWYPPGKGKGEGEREREGERVVPRSLGDVLDVKMGIRVDNSGRRRRDVQNMVKVRYFFLLTFGCNVLGSVLCRLLMPKWICKRKSSFSVKVNVS